jgi:putative acetyltransferase
MSDAASVREADTSDLEAIYGVVAAAFERTDEAALVARLIEDRDVWINLVAEQDDVIVGNVIVSPIRLEPAVNLRCGGVAPLSVSPSMQGRGIGSQLMFTMIEGCRAADVDALFLLGHADYYPRFGFRPSRIGNEYGATDSFMDLALTPGCLNDATGNAYYAKAFRETNN